MHWLALNKLSLCCVCGDFFCREWLVNVTDQGFSPPTLGVSTEDRVWFVWDKKQCKKGQNVLLHSNSVDSTGAEEGKSPRLLPRKVNLSREGRFSQLFSKPGIFIFHSQGLPSHLTCTVVVRPSKSSESVTFSEAGFQPSEFSILAVLVTEVRVAKLVTAHSIVAVWGISLCTLLGSFICCFLSETLMVHFVSFGNCWYVLGADPGIL